MTNRRMCDLPHVDCIVIDPDTVRIGGSAFARVYEVPKADECARCGKYMGYDALYCKHCGAKAVER